MTCAKCTSYAHMLKQTLFGTPNCDECIKKTWPRCMSCFIPINSTNLHCDDCEKMTEHCDFCDVSIPAYKKMCDECTRMRENVKRVCESINQKNVR